MLFTLICLLNLFLYLILLHDYCKTKFFKIIQLVPESVEYSILC